MASKLRFCPECNTTLVYRQQQTSRAYKLKHVNKQFEVMQRQIKAMHSEIYAGRFPMACCGKGATAATNPDPVMMSQQAQGATRITALEGFEEKDLEWVAYQGGKRARFDILARGPAGLPPSYTILGTDHFFQIHKAHRKLFSDRQRLGFQMDQPDPRKQSEPEVSPPAITPQVVELPKPPNPEMSVIMRPDRVAVESGITIQPAPMSREEVIIEPNPAPSYSDTMNWQSLSFRLADLGLSVQLTSTLNGNNWTVESLARGEQSDIDRLIALPGIGVKTANRIIAKAKELIKQG